jgi:hypothetical protein
VSEKRIDVLLDVQKKHREGDRQMINMDSIKTENVREFGVEWLSLQTLRKLQIEEYLSSEGWNKRDIDLAMAIFHKHDESSMTHLHLGMLAYWLMNTVRFQLKSKWITSDRREPVRIMKTQYCVTTNMVNDKNEHIS